MTARCNFRNISSLLLLRRFEALIFSVEDKNYVAYLSSPIGKTYILAQFLEFSMTSYIEQIIDGLGNLAEVMTSGLAEVRSKDEVSIACEDYCCDHLEINAETGLKYHWLRR